MNLVMGRLISLRRYQQLLNGSFPHLRNRAVRHERLFGVKTVYLSPSHVDLNGGRATAAVVSLKGWQEVVLSPSPRIFHNLLTYPSGKEGQALRALNGDLRVVVFNETNRWHRDLVHGILSTDPRISPYLPVLSPYSQTDPEPSSELVDHNRHHLLVTARRPLPDNSYLVDQSGNYRPIGRTTGGSLGAIRWALTLPGPPQFPAGFDSPMDWRLYILRDPDLGSWEVPAWVAKCETRTKSNSWPLFKALHQTYGTRAPEIQGLLYHAGMSIAETLARYMPGITHFAADFWIDSAGQPFLVDQLGKFRFDWLRRVGDQQAVEYLRNHPVKFALALQGTGVGKLHVDFGRIGANPK